MLSPETQAKFAIWRAKAAEGTLTIEEQKEAIAAIRGDRRAAAVTKESATRKRAKAIIPNADDLLDELNSL